MQYVSWFRQTAQFRAQTFGDLWFQPRRWVVTIKTFNFKQKDKGSTPLGATWDIISHHSTTFHTIKFREVHGESRVNRSLTIISGLWNFFSSDQNMPKPSQIKTILRYGLKHAKFCQKWIQNMFKKIRPRIMLQKKSRTKPVDYKLSLVRYHRQFSDSENQIFCCSNSTVSKLHVSNIYNFSFSNQTKK